MTISIIKSLCVALVLLTLATGTILSIIHYIKLATARSVTLRHFLVALGCVLMVVLGVVLLGDCIYPFERELEPILIAECELAADHIQEYPGEIPWHGAYENAFYFDMHTTQSHLGFEWPLLDLDHYSYIVTYGQKIESLSYNVWDTLDVEFESGVFAGHIVLDDEFFPEKVFVYQIPHIDIDNDHYGFN